MSIKKNKKQKQNNDLIFLMRSCLTLWEMRFEMFSKRNGTHNFPKTQWKDNQNSLHDFEKKGKNMVPILDQISPGYPTQVIAVDGIFKNSFLFSCIHIPLF